MKIEFEDEGGGVELTAGEGASTTLDLVRTPGGQLRIALRSRSRDGEMWLGVGLNAEQARDIGEFLLAHTVLLDEDSDSDSEE